MIRPVMFAAVFFILIAAPAADQALKLASAFRVHRIYDDYMVLQRGRPIRISGTANPGEAVQVTIGANSANGIAGADGEWAAVLPPMKAGGPYQVTVSGAPECAKITFNDVLVGEVWLAGGQSNMEMPVFSPKPFWSSLNGRQEAARADYPNIRLYNATSKKSVSPYEPQSDPIGPGWRICTPETAAPFSAAAFYFGRRLQEDLGGVPVGLISASWGGTRIEPWISRGGFENAGRTRELMQIKQATGGKDYSDSFEAAKAEAKRRFQEWEKRFFSTYAAETRAAADWKNPDLDDSNWDVVVNLASSFPNDKDGVGWYRKTVEIPPEWAGQELTLSLGVLDDCDITYFNGFRVGSTDSTVENYWSVRRSYKIPGALVKTGRAVIAVRLIDYFMNGGFQSPTNEMYLSAKDGRRLPLSGAWRFKLEFAVDPAKIGIRPDPLGYMKISDRHPNFPATLYNSMIAPWIGFPIRGVIWYQGESNVGSAADYAQLHKLLITDWRRLWHDPELAFIFVQLSGFEKHTPSNRLSDHFQDGREPGESSWAELREAQAAALALPHTGMAVSIDAGDHSDIHPANKQIIGFRLAREAERLCYEQNIVSAGPCFKSMKIEGDKAILAFTNIGSGLIAQGSENGHLNGFAVADEHGKFFRADAVIDGDKVIVSSPLVKTPATVRYAWANYAGNLNFYNKEGFPAAPFRTNPPDYLGK